MASMTVRLEAIWYSETQQVELELASYDSERKGNTWHVEDRWLYEPGDRINLGEPETMWEVLTDAMVQAHGLQLSLPFE